MSDARVITYAEIVSGVDTFILLSEFVHNQLLEA